MIGPERFDRYEIVRKLPGGGMGRVYVALDTSTRRQVALKLIDHGNDADSCEIVEAERRGAQLQERLCRLDPRVTVINHYGDHDGYFFIDMEYIEGKDLSNVVEQSIGVPFALRIAQDICEVLDLAHNFETSINGHQYRGIVHGDIKPRNIRITPEGKVKVLDFGIAKALSHSRKHTRNLFASTRYSSPERLSQGEVDVPSDLWSVGIVLYEMVARRPYFEAESAPRMDHMIRNYTALKPLPPDMPAGLKDVLTKALAPGLEDRYPSAAAFRDALGTLRAELSNGALSRVQQASAEETTGKRVVSEEPVETSRSTVEDEATRRSSAVDEATRRDADEDASTRRTAPSPSQRAPAAAPAPAKIKQPARPEDPRIRLARRLLKTTVLVVVAWVMISEYRVWSASAELRSEIETERLNDLNEAWDRYSKLADRSAIGVSLYSTRKALKQRLMADADRVIADYRESDVPSVAKSDWKRAQTHLARALQLDPGDDELRGRLRLADGHVDRIAAAEVRQMKLWHQARAHFVEAAERMKRSPDPYLGLARVYTYGLHDPDKTEEAIRQAEKLGFRKGKRERAQLADGYRDRAGVLLRAAQKWRGNSQEDEYLRRAEEDYNRAKELYEAIHPFMDSADALRAVYKQLDSIYARTSELRSQ